MSVLDTVREKIGLEDETPRYECRECGAEFRRELDPDSHWFECPECGGDDVTRLDE